MDSKGRKVIVCDVGTEVCFIIIKLSTCMWDVVSFERTSFWYDFYIFSPSSVDFPTLRSQRILFLRWLVKAVSTTQNRKWMQWRLVLIFTIQNTAGKDVNQIKNFPPNKIIFLNFFFRFSCRLAMKPENIVVNKRWTIQWIILELFEAGKTWSISGTTRSVRRSSTSIPRLAK